MRYYGNEVSEYGAENGRVDYKAFAKCFQHVLNNNIISKTDDWEVISDASWDDVDEVMQWYVIDYNAADFIKSELPFEVVMYSSDFDMCLWGVTHFGTSWDYVLTNIEVTE